MDAGRELGVFLLKSQQQIVACLSQGIMNQAPIPSRPQADVPGVMSAPPAEVSLADSPPRHRAGSDAPFFVALGGLGGSYLLLIVLMLAADLAFTSPTHFAQACRSLKSNTPSGSR